MILLHLEIQKGSFHTFSLKKCRSAACISLSMHYIIIPLTYDNYFRVHFVPQKLEINQWYNRGPVCTQQ